MPAVSVIIPVYNAEKYLRECLDSVVNQTLKDIEIICVNDGSTDSSLDILKEYAQKDNRIKIINQENKGVGVARNEALKEVASEYFMFLDSDDYFMPNAFEVMLKNIQSETDIDCVICNIKSGIKEKSKILEDKVVEVSPKNIFKPNCIVWNKIYKTSIIKKYNLEHPKIRCYYEDNIFIFKYSISCKKIKYIKDELYYYRTDNSMSLMSQGKMRQNQNVPLPQLMETLDIYQYICRNNLYRFMDSYFEFFVQTIFYWYPMMTKENRLCTPDILKKNFESYDLTLFSKRNIKTIERCIQDSSYIGDFIDNYYNKNKQFYFACDFNRFYLKIFSIKIKFKCR